MPLAAQAADPAIFREDVGISHLVGEISGCGLADVALADPVVDSVLRGDPPGQKVARLGEQTGVATKKLSKRMPVWGDAVDCWSADFRVAVAASGPRALVVAEDEDDVGTIH